MSVKVITYHHIINDDEKTFHGISLQILERQIAFMEKIGWKPLDITIEEEITEFIESKIQ